MNCPKCKNNELKTTQLDNGLNCLSCESCQGSLLPMFSYLEWIQQQTSIALDTDTDITLDNTCNAIQCPKCSGLMTKYLISSHSDNRLDICFRCYETWLDCGEWQLLKFLNILNHLPKIFTEYWQENIRNSIANDLQKQRDIQLFGQHFQDIQKFKNWLDCYSKKDDVLLYLNRQCH